MWPAPEVGGEEQGLVGPAIFVGRGRPCVTKGEAGRDDEGDGEPEADGDDDLVR